MTAGDKFQSAVFTGWVRHRRFVPVSHEFEYPLFMLWLDLDELAALFRKKWYCSIDRFNLVSFHRKDYYGDADKDLKTAVIERVDADLRSRGIATLPLVKVRMLTQVRYVNFVFNPVSFYYCYDAKNNLQAILAEITNTPWDERHAYVLPIGHSSAGMCYECKGQEKHIFEFDKAFHVSPFNPMNMRYRWAFNNPDSRCIVHMDNHLNGTVPEDQPKHFDATLSLRRKNFVDDFASVLIRFPWITVKIVTGIYWQAMKLWFKKVPFYDHPGT